jgi:hypothetical protein
MRKNQVATTRFSGEDFAVVERPKSLGLEQVYENHRFRVYKVDCGGGI